MVLPSMSRSKQTNQPARNKKYTASTVFVCSLLGLLFNPEDGGSMFLQNNGKLLLFYLASCPRRQFSSLWVHTNSFNRIVEVRNQGFGSHHLKE
jgi:hypothetical protein